MQNAFSRMEMLLGKKETERLAGARIAVFGIGGVGSAATEALARCGVGSLSLIDGSELRTTDINRNAFAMRSTVGQLKVEAAKRFVHEIDDNILVNTYATYCNDETIELMEFQNFDYVVDATGELGPNALIARAAAAKKVPMLLCSSIDGREDYARLEVAELWRRQVYGLHPILKKLRVDFKDLSSARIKVLFSREKDSKTHGSVAYVTAIAGMMAAAEVVQDLLQEVRKKPEEVKKESRVKPKNENRK